MNILVLHGLGNDFARARGTSVAHLLCFEKYAPEHRYLYQDLARPVSSSLKQFPFDLILIDGTFLCWRWVRPRQLLEELKNRYEWIADHPAVKIAFPQDDYDHSQILDEWLDEWNIDFVYSACANHGTVLYPLVTAKPGKLVSALTGRLG